jgi:hypothetical protein
MDARYQVEFVETLQRIRNEFEKLTIRKIQLERERKILDKLRGIQAIHNEAFNAQTMSPEEHLRHSYQYEKAISEFKKSESDLRLSTLDFFILCRYNLPDTQLIKLASDEGCEIRSSMWPGIVVISEIAPNAARPKQKE